eukprot:9476059-Pyramimonas_sp.AAC.1
MGTRGTKRAGPPTSGAVDCSPQTLPPGRARKALRPHRATSAHGPAPPLEQSSATAIARTRARSQAPCARPRHALKSSSGGRGRAGRTRHHGPREC